MLYMRIKLILNTMLLWKSISPILALNDEMFIIETVSMILYLPKDDKSEHFDHEGDLFT